MASPTCATQLVEYFRGGRVGVRCPRHCRRERARASGSGTSSAGCRTERHRPMGASPASSERNDATRGRGRGGSQPAVHSHPVPSDRQQHRGADRLRRRAPAQAAPARPRRSRRRSGDAPVLMARRVLHVGRRRRVPISQPEQGNARRTPTKQDLRAARLPVSTPSDRARRIREPTRCSSPTRPPLYAPATGRVPSACPTRIGNGAQSGRRLGTTPATARSDSTQSRIESSSGRNVIGTAARMRSLRS